MRAHASSSEGLGPWLHRDSGPESARSRTGKVGQERTLLRSRNPGAGGCVKTSSRIHDSRILGDSLYLIRKASNLRPPN